MSKNRVIYGYSLVRILHKTTCISVILPVTGWLNISFKSSRSVLLTTLLERLSLVRFIFSYWMDGYYDVKVFSLFRSFWKPVNLETI